MTTPISTEDQAALDAATTAGRLYVPTLAEGSELSAGAGVALMLSWHLARVKARVDVVGDASGTAKELAFASVDREWPAAWDVSKFPRATILMAATNVDDALICQPVRKFDADAQKLVDVVTDDFALWRRGEDTGEGVIAIHANFASHAEALARAVRAALGGDLTKRVGASLPMPRQYLPTPFVGSLDVRARVAPKSGGSSLERAAQAEGGGWRMDVHFSWQAPTFECRARIPDLTPSLVVTVATAT